MSKGHVTTTMSIALFTSIPMKHLRTIRLQITCRAETDNRYMP